MFQGSFTGVSRKLCLLILFSMAVIAATRAEGALVFVMMMIIMIFRKNRIEDRVENVYGI